MHSIRPICTLMLATLLFSGCTAGRTNFSKGEKLEREGNLDAALVKYAQATSENPEVAEYRVRFLKVTDLAARAHYKKGEAYFALKNYEDALREYQTAYAMDPTNQQAKLQGDLVLRLKNAQTYYLQGVDFEKDRKPREALDAYRHALEFDPGNQQLKDSVQRLVTGKKQKLDGYELNLKSTKPITLKFRDAKLKEVFNILSQLSGINFVFDDAVKDVNVSLMLENATFQQAMEIITGMQKLGRKVLNESTIVLYPRTPDKIKQYEDLFLETFYLNKLDAKKAVNLIRTMLQVKKIYVNEEANALVIRDTPEVIDVARKILEANDVPDAEVLLDVEVFELSKANTEAFGLLLSKYSVAANATTPQGQFLVDSLSAVTTTAATIPGQSTTTTTPATPSNLLNLFAYKGYNGYLTVPNAAFNFGKTIANGETLSNPKIRVKNREKAKFNVGTRVPITTTSAPVGGGVSVSVQYVDVGVKVNAEPVIQLNNDVSIKLSLEVSSILSQQTIGTDQATTVVTIGTRNLDTVLSLKDGETSIIGGLIQNAKTENKNKIFLLGDIPFLGALFSNTNDTNNKTELLLAITPRIVRGVTVPDTDVAAFWSGREDEPSTNKPYASFTQEGEISPAGPPPGSVAATGLPVGSVPAGAPSTSRRPGPEQGTAAGTPAAIAKGAEPTAKAALPAAAPAPATPPPAVPAPPAPAVTPAAPAGVLPRGVQAPAPAPVIPAPPAATPQQAAKAVVPAAPAAPAAAPAEGAVVMMPTPPPLASEVAASKLQLSLSLPPSVKLNDQFAVQVNVSGAKQLQTAVFVLSYDPKKLQLVSQAEGPMLKQNGNVIFSQAIPEKQKGELWVNQSRVNPGAGASGNGSLLTVTFKAIGKGSTGLTLGSTDFSNAQGNKIDVIPFKSVVEVK